MYQLSQAEIVIFITDNKFLATFFISGLSWIAAGYKLENISPSGQEIIWIRNICLARRQESQCRDSAQAHWTVNQKGFGWKYWVVLTIKSKKVNKIILLIVNKAEEFCGSELSVAEGVMWSNMNINESLAENKWIKQIER